MVITLLTKITIICYKIQVKIRPVSIVYQGSNQGESDNSSMNGDYDGKIDLGDHMTWDSLWCANKQCIFYLCFIPCKFDNRKINDYHTQLYML